MNRIYLVIIGAIIGFIITFFIFASINSHGFAKSVIDNKSNNYKFLDTKTKSGTKFIGIKYNTEKICVQEGTTKECTNTVYINVNEIKEPSDLPVIFDPDKYLHLASNCRCREFVDGMLIIWGNCFNIATSSCGSCSNETLTCSNIIYLE